MNGFRMIPFLSDCPFWFLFPLSFDGALVVGVSSPLVVVFFSACAVDKDVTSGIRAVVMAAVVAGLETNKGRFSPFRIRVRLKQGSRIIQIYLKLEVSYTRITGFVPS